MPNSRRSPPLQVTHFSQTETDLYERALESSIHHLVQFASNLPQFEENFAARSLQQIAQLAANVDEILTGLRQIEKSIGTSSQDKRAREFEIDYRFAAQRSLDYLEIFGIDLPPDTRRQKLSVGYISLSLESSSEEVSQFLPAETLFSRIGPDGRLLIRGDAGSGKSTLLRWAAMQAATGSSTFAHIQQIDSVRTELGKIPLSDKITSLVQWRVPFFIRLRHCPNGSFPRLEEFPKHITRAIGDPPTDWVKSIFKEGRALLLLDGIDEVPNAYRETTRREIEDLVAQYPRTYFVISTRPRAVDFNWLESFNFREARINPLSELDRAKFVDKWHEAVAASTSQDLASHKEVAESLKRELDNNPEVARLTTNPLLCAMICALYRDRHQQLPERQRQLCEDLCHALLHRRERESGLNLADFPEPYRRLDYHQKRAAVQELAHHMVLNEYSSIPVEEAQEQIAKALRQFHGHSAVNAPIVTEALVERSGILREESPGVVSFTHNAFKDLLAGDYFATEDSAGLLANHALDPNWQQVILFAVATDRRGFATKVIRNILDVGPHLSKPYMRAKQLMALRCRAAALYIEEEIDIRLKQLTATLFPPKNMEDAEALSTSGNTAVSFLIYNDKLDESEAAASVRALRLIGTSRAREALRGFLKDLRGEVVSELAQAVNPLEIEWVRERLLAAERLPEGIGSQVADLTPLKNLDKLDKLEILDLTSTRVADLSPLGELSNLQRLYLAMTPVKDLSPLMGVTSLQVLDLVATQVTDISPLAQLENLQSLYLADTRVADIAPLARLKNLHRLVLRATRVADLSPLSELKNLQLVRP